VWEKKQITYKGKPIKITAGRLLKWNLKSKKVFQALKENNFSPRILYPTKLSFRIDGGISLPQRTETKTIYDHQATTIEDSERNPTHTQKMKTNTTTKGQEVLNLMRRPSNHSENSTESAAHTQILKKKPIYGRNHHIPLNIDNEC
jgi:hypothetical protein